MPKKSLLCPWASYMPCSQVWNRGTIGHYVGILASCFTDMKFLRWHFCQRKHFRQRANEPTSLESSAESLKNTCRWNSHFRYKLRNWLIRYLVSCNGQVDIMSRAIAAQDKEDSKGARGAVKRESSLTYRVCEHTIRRIRYLVTWKPLGRLVRSR